MKNSYRKDQKRKKEKSMRQIALAEKKRQDNRMKGKKTKMVPHPTAPRAYIEIIIEDQ